MKIEVNYAPLFGAARHQGMRLTCLAFAASDLNRMASNAPGDLSPEFLYQQAGSTTPNWQAGEGLYLAPTLLAAGNPGQPLETHYPYQAAAPAFVQAPVPPTDVQLHSSALTAIVPTGDNVIDQIRQGHAVGLILESTETLFYPKDGVVAFSTNILLDRVHAVLAVGLGEAPDGVHHVLIRNSWGVTWGDQGYAWLPKQYIDMHALEAFGR
ncbi:MAG: hypothetical protein EON93_02120 [Burkholderiales bacterium]|nr:MAG: hypothetical protein EON93_02120 [Burkholderiales bacterium]